MATNNTVQQGSQEAKVKNWIVGLGQKSTHGGFTADLVLFKEILSLSYQ